MAIRVGVVFGDDQAVEAVGDLLESGHQRGVFFGGVGLAGGEEEEIRSRNGDLTRNQNPHLPSDARLPLP